MIEHYNAIYLQDDFRLNSKLTLNLGVRYEYEPGQSETQNQYTVGFDTKAINPLSNGSNVALGGYAFAGVNGYPTHCCNQSNTKFAPRIGAAYEVRKGTVVRAGFGVFYAPVGLTAAATGYSQSTAYSPNALTANLPTSSLGPTAYLSTPFNSGAAVLKPSGNTLGYLTGVGNTVSVTDFGRRFPFVEQYSMDVQQELPYGIALKIGYVGAHSRNFANSVNINQLPNSVMATYVGGSGLKASVTNPYYSATVGGYPATGVTANKTTTLAQTLLPFPEFTSVTLSESNGHSLYNAFDIKVQKRLAKGLSVISTYTWVV